MPDKPSVIRETDNDARRQARILLRGARFAAIGVIDPETSFPSVTRVLLGSDTDGAAVILVSGLSAHTKALSADTRASLLAGEPGKGDPLAYPRLSVQCVAEPVERDGAAHARLRARFLARHPKSSLYIDFPDFRFFRLVPRSASLNGGFGRAFHLSGNDFAIREPAGNLLENEQKTLLDLGERFPDLASRIATGLHKAPAGKWGFCGLDSSGIDIIYKDLLVRHEFSEPVDTQEQLHLELPNSAYAVP